MKSGAVLTERQQKWFATVEANFEKATGRPVAVWVDILKGCPETRPRAQAAWLKATHGIGANHAAHILNAARPDEAMGWDDAEALRAALWAEPRSLAILEAIERAAAGVDGVIPGQRKGYTAFSRAVQFAATRPLKGGRALLGLKLDPSVSPRLSEAVRRESWSERLIAVVELDGPGAVNAEIGRLFAQAADNG
ncbi:MAG: DUF4287 domain-containing protein [Brevundimonas sp.]|uniref:DUF4287 domain-containing protein n=1 Tax=Brevundimonas sp. TaxID=1871086 RepID=UPI002725A20C|nr:DUF4287 domain-containing protein [Brevundimonas sp.]MDO9076073.1 DUF4287 domain-containing protein [Brevundimonas sp.]MDP3081495.1 DUF4287 domain-containing protein [Brevundimonas sp.]MDZ4061190.1 DUF4287 domain-containing protein [Brevundimonas sp.]